MEEILQKNERAKSAFKLIAHKTRIESSKEYIAMGAVMKFFEDLPDMISLDNSSDWSKLEKDYEEELAKLTEERNAFESKLRAAAKKIKALSDKNIELEEKLNQKVEQEFAKSLEIDNEDFNFDFEEGED